MHFEGSYNPPDNPEDHWINEWKVKVEPLHTTKDSEGGEASTHSQILDMLTGEFAEVLATKCTDCELLLGAQNAR